MNKKGRLPAIKDTSNLVMRSISTERRNNGVVVVATETPVDRWDEEKQIVIREVLLMDGCRFRGGRTQIPIVDSHNDTTVRNIFGSVRNLQVDSAAGELYGVPVFASDAISQETAIKVDEGHITDFSVTARTFDGFFVPSGKTYTTPRGNVIEGPANIITDWEPHNASVCTTGADVNSVVLRSYTDLKRGKVKRMDEALLSTLSGLGVPADMTDPSQIIAFLAGKLTPVEEMGSEVMVENADMSAMSEDEKPIVENMDSAASDEETPVERMNTEEVARSAALAERKRTEEIYAACKTGRIERAFADKLVKLGVPVDEARKRIIERMSSQALGQTAEQTSVRVTESADDKFYGAVRDGLIQRSFAGARIRAKHEGVSGAGDFSRLNLGRIAELVLRQQGINTDRMSNVDVAKVAMGNREAMRRFNIERSAYHTSGSFSNLLLDAANKTLLQAYEEAPYTWNLWARQAPSVPDFKNINRIRFSESPDPEMVPERQEYKEKTMSDSKESYKVEKYGALFTVSWETVVNDDLDAISRIPAMHGAACRRKVNKEVYAVLTANANMGDGVALFGSHASGANLSGADASPAVGTLNTAFAAMMKQKGLSDDVIISVQPRYLIVPVALGATALELVNSTSYIVANGNEGVQNLYGVGGPRSLRVVEEATLDSNSITAWYLAADPSQIDTVEVSFLQGEETPVLEDEWDFDHDVYKYKVRQTFGVKAIDWRGLYKYAAS